MLEVLRRFPQELIEQLTETVEQYENGLFTADEMQDLLGDHDAYARFGMFGGYQILDQITDYILVNTID